MGVSLTNPRQRTYSMAPPLHHLPPPTTPLHHRGKHRPASPWNHTYTEIREQAGSARAEEDPVYEEIEREREREQREREREQSNDIQVSDMSDEDGRRQSDMSRQSSRSYGDHRPLIPYSPPHPLTPDRNFQTALDVAFRHRLKEQTRHQTGTVAVLDGETVVCHLQPDSQLYSCRTAPHQPYSEC